MRKKCLSVIYFSGNYKKLFCLEYLVFSNECVVFVQESMKKLFFECGKLFFFGEASEILKRFLQTNAKNFFIWRDGVRTLIFWESIRNFRWGFVLLIVLDRLT